MSRKHNVNNWKAIVIGLLACLFEICLLLTYLYYNLPLFLLILFHAIVIGLLFLFVYLSAKKEEDLRYPLILLLSAFGAGPFGEAGFLLQSILRPIFSKFSTPALIWFENLFPLQKQRPFIKIYERVRSGWDYYNARAEVSSFRELFTLGTLAEKQAVLDAIAKDFDPLYAPILKQALSDPLNTVRIQAAAIMSKIDMDFHDELEKSLSKHDESPDDVNCILQLAQKYDAYVSLGILYPIREKENAERAIHYYNQYLHTHPDEQTIWLAVARLLFQAGDYEEFIGYYRKYESKFKIVPRILGTWYLEALLRLGRYEEFTENSKGFFG